MNFINNFRNREEDISDKIIKYFEWQVQLLKCDIEIAEINREIEEIKNEYAQ